MNRRNFLGLLAAVPGLGWLKPAEVIKVGGVICAPCDRERVTRILGVDGIMTRNEVRKMENL